MTGVMTHSRGVHELGPAVIALGVFDGVHLGHQTLVSETIAIARERRSMSCVLTFDRDPDQVVTPDRAAPQLTTFEDKIALLKALGPDAILVVPFDEWLASLSPDDFCLDVLLDASEPVACVVGFDFRFGSRAAGDASTLAALGSLHGFDVVTHPLVRIGGEPVTSTRIRDLVSRGSVAEAGTLLGRPHRLHGIVERGMGLGRSLGAPTANLSIDSRFALPAAGVYAAWATIPAGRFAAAVSVGIPPTFPEATCPLEAHLLEFDDDLYGAPVMLEFVERIRDPRAFASPELLAAAIAEDVGKVSVLLLG